MGIHTLKIRVASSPLVEVGRKPNFALFHLAFRYGDECAYAAIQRQTILIFNIALSFDLGSSIMGPFETSSRHQENPGSRCSRVRRRLAGSKLITGQDRLMKRQPAPWDRSGDLQLLPTRIDGQHCHPRWGSVPGGKPHPGSRNTRHRRPGLLAGKWCPAWLPGFSEGGGGGGGGHKKPGAHVSGLHAGLLQSARRLRWVAVVMEVNVALQGRVKAG